ncbi:peptidase [Nitrosopumilus sp.]|uniref:peptidase n=1 Tax=Nitrosopumilus sp. TaxID=2024843 RepID=UPI003D09C39F
MKNSLVLLFVLIFSIAGSTELVFGHGFGSETLPPASIGDRDVTFSISVLPSIFDPNVNEHLITLNLFDSKTETAIEHVTFELEFSKNKKQLFKEVFHDETGTLKLSVISDDSEQISIQGTQEPILGGWLVDDENPLTFTGPIFTSGGLYEYKVKILSIDSDSNVLKSPIGFEGGISIADHQFFYVDDHLKQSQKLHVVSYFDQIQDFDFDSNQLTFTIPFDWNQNFQEISVIHQEVRIPNTFSDFLSTNYDSYVNGLLLPHDITTIDDYSFDDRTVHTVITRDLLKLLKNNVQTSDEIIEFTLQPNDQVDFPLYFTTSDYQVFLYWEPEIIRAGEDVIFFIDFQQIFSDHHKHHVEYDFSVIQQGDSIYQKHFKGDIDSDYSNVHQVNFDPKNSGSANLLVSNIDGDPQSKGNFIIVIEPGTSQNSETNGIPSWVKSNAGWWADGSIDDDSFIQGIQFLIDENIIQIPPTLAGSNSQTNDIPVWVKVNAGWWADGSIDDDSFVKGMQFLIKSGIISLN